MFKCLKQSLHSNYQGTGHTHTQTDTAFYNFGLLFFNFWIILKWLYLPIEPPCSFEQLCTTIVLVPSGELHTIVAVMTKAVTRSACVASYMEFVFRSLSINPGYCINNQT